MNKSEPIAGIRCTHCGQINVISNLMSMTLEDAIPAWIKTLRYAPSRQQINEKFSNSSPASIKNVLTRLRRNGTLVHAGHGYWTTPDAL